MRWPQESAITRRDDHLARTRRLSLWIAGGAAAASLALATAFGYALPGHAVTSGAQAPASHSGRGSGHSGAGRSGHGGSGRQLAPPQQPPSGSVAPPVVSSGGS
ncbi:MAG TPA: hypothetical protein VN840_09300 [Streptosporangiaceae bacterium]|nr:hypothetical protein [Streptosporangiaceae bacterium]